jgi:hypothetical protein
MVFKTIRNLFIILVVIGIAWGAWSLNLGILIMSSSLLVIWFALDRIYIGAVNGLIEVAHKHEDFFCELWESRILSIRFYNGNSYAVHHKFENGSYISYNN